MHATLAAGITTVRDAAGADLGIKVAQERGLIPGPRLQISVNMISQTGGHNDDWEASGCHLTWFKPHPGRPPAVVDGAEEMRRKVRELVRAGADVIKIATSGGVLSPRDDPRHAHFRDREVAVAVEEASAVGIHVMAHAGSTEGIKTALRNGVRSIEHGDFLDDEAIMMMLERGAWLVPTLIAGRGVLEVAGSGLPLGSHILDKAKMVVEAQEASIRRAIAAGVRIAMGSDSGVTPHGQNLDELNLMIQFGMTPAGALHAATLSAAELMGLDQDLGSLEPGKRADLIIVEGNPLDTTGLASRIRRVYQDGRLTHDAEAAHRGVNSPPPTDADERARSSR
jgi:imidazolonepropionase-like amidohydrolase